MISDYLPDLPQDVLCWKTGCQDTASFVGDILCCRGIGGAMKYHGPSGSEVKYQLAGKALSRNLLHRGIERIGAVEEIAPIEQLDGFGLSLPAKKGYIPF